LKPSHGATSAPPTAAANPSPWSSCQELYISHTTVKTHITHILQKLDPRDRVQAVVLAYETRLFDTESQPPRSHDGRS
jgi:hypothetical protein